MPHTPAPWVYEPATKTIRSLPTNYWLASMDSFDGAVDHEANARLMACAPALLAQLESALAMLEEFTSLETAFDPIRATIAQAKGE